MSTEYEAVAIALKQVGEIPPEVDVQEIAEYAKLSAFSTIAQRLAAAGFPPDVTVPPTVSDDLDRAFRLFVRALAAETSIGSVDDEGMEYFLPGIEAGVPEELPYQEGITVAVECDYTTHGALVSIAAPTEDEIVDYVRDHWGDDDAEWFAHSVVASITRRRIAPVRKIVVTLTVEIPEEVTLPPWAIAEALVSPYRHGEAVYGRIHVDTADEVTE